MARQDYIAKNEIKSLARTSDLAGILLVLHCWGTIVLMMAMFVIWPNFLTFIVAFFVVSGRQLGMAILMHDASHGLLFKTEKLLIPPHLNPLLPFGEYTQCDRLG